MRRKPYCVVLFDEIEKAHPDEMCIRDRGGSAVLDLKYDADSFWALGDEALSIVQLDGSLAGQYDYGGRYLKAFSLGGDRSAALLLGKYRAGSGATLLTVDAAGQELAALELDDQVLDLDAAGRYVAVLTAGRLDLYTRDLELYASLDTTCLLYTSSGNTPARLPSWYGLSLRFPKNSLRVAAATRRLFSFTS